MSNSLIYILVIVAIIIFYYFRIILINLIFIGKDKNVIYYISTDDYKEITLSFFMTNREELFKTDLSYYLLDSKIDFSVSLILEIQKLNEFMDIINN